MIQTISKLHEKGSERNVGQHQASCILLCIQSLLQALHTSSGHLDSFYAHCAHQHTVRTLACNELEVSGSKWYWRNNIWYQTMSEWNSVWLSFCLNLEFVTFRIPSSLFYQWTVCVCVLMCHQCCCKEGVFSIPSLDVKHISKIVSKIVISDT